MLLMQGAFALTGKPFGRCCFLIVLIFLFLTYPTGMLVTKKIKTIKKHLSASCIRSILTT
ncbi:hypothetical protein Dip510_000168 [Elusimicrobium posterum]